MEKIKTILLLTLLFCFSAAGISGGFGLGLPSIVEDKAKNDMDEKIKEKTFPSVSITNPSGGALVSGSVNITADASDDEGVKRVEFYIDNSLKKTEESLSYEYLWDTAAGSAGKYSIDVKAYDTDNNSASAGIRVTVDNGHLFPDTGQTTVYRTGDDASYNPPPRQLAYVDNGDGTVRDILTGLVWLKDADDFHNGNNMLWEVAISSCESFAYAGYSDWRLPNIKELSSIFSFEGDTPYIVDSPFINVKASYYWSSTTDVGSYNVSGDTDAMRVSFYYGTVNGYEKDTPLLVYPVRGGADGQERELPDTGQTTSYTDTYGEDSDYNPAVSSMSYTDNSDGMVTDNLTGLMWVQNQDDYSASGQTWADAIDGCESFSYAGHNDWRLPNVKELLSIVKYEGTPPLINETYFPNTKYLVAYWSSTTKPDDTTKGITVDFRYGNAANYQSKTGTCWVRPVRDIQ
ncbi:MAG: DUF1566 domain-containing protein [Elusimicrobiota bacterium]